MAATAGQAAGHTVWVWQVGQDYPGADTDDRHLPVGRVWAKAFDGLTAQGVYDGHALALRDRAAVRTLREVYAGQGIDLGVWAVPHGVYPGYGPRAAVDAAMRPPPGAPDSYAYREGYAHGAAAAAAGDGQRAVLVADVEPSYYGGATPQFWRDDRGAGADEARTYLAGAAAGGVTAVWFSAAFRRDGGALRDVAAAAWLRHPLVAGLCPQVYWTDFGGGWRSAFRELDAALEAIGFGDYPRARIAPVLPGDATAADLAAAWEYCIERGFARPSIWRRGTVAVEAWQRLATLRWPGAVQPAPAEPLGESLGEPLGEAHRLVQRAERLLAAALGDAPRE